MSARLTAIICMVFVGGSYIYCNILKPNESDTTKVEQMLENISSFASSEEAVDDAYSDKLSDEIINNYTNVKPLNEDIVGWIYGTNTNINYPITSGDNNFYLNRDHNKKPSKAGSIFLDENQLVISPVSLIHGHNMLNGSMFSHLKKFAKEDFFYNNKVYLYDGKEMKEYVPLSFIRVGQETTFQVHLTEKEDIKKYAQELASKSKIKAKIEPNGNDLLILNTCTSDGTTDHNILILQKV